MVNFHCHVSDSQKVTVPGNLTKFPGGRIQIQDSLEVNSHGQNIFPKNFTSKSYNKKIKLDFGEDFREDSREDILAM